MYGCFVCEQTLSPNGIHVKSLCRLFRLVGSPLSLFRHAVQIRTSKEPQRTFPVYDVDLGFYLRARVAFPRGRSKKSRGQKFYAEPQHCERGPDARGRQGVLHRRSHDLTSVSSPLEKGS